MTGADGSSGAGSERSALRHSEETFRLLVESVIDYAIFVLDPDGVVRTWNAGAERLKGYAQDEIVGRHYSTFYPPEYLAEDLPATLLRRAREEGRAEHSGWRVRRDGTRFWADVVITALYDEDGEHTGFAKVTRDMTEAHETAEAREQALEDQRDAVARLQDLDRWRRDFVTAVVHDLQNPVTAILGFAALLPDETDPAERANITERIRSNGRSLQHLIGNLRADVSLTEGQISLSPEPLDLRRSVADVLADMAPLLHGRAVEVGVPEVEVEVDGHALERILRNLIGNAVKHTDPGSRIRVSGSVGDEHVTVSVEDEGEGVPDDVLPRIFERFETGSRDGMGLGLSVVRQYVELHGGTVAASNRPEGGASFRFTLPR